MSISAKLIRSIKNEGLIVSAPTIHVPKEVLVNTVLTYNEDEKRGVDLQFNRKTLTHTFGTPTPIEEGHIIRWKQRRQCLIHMPVYR